MRTSEHIVSAIVNTLAAVPAFVLVIWADGPPWAAFMTAIFVYVVRMAEDRIVAHLNGTSTLKETPWRASSSASSGRTPANR